MKKKLFPLLGLLVLTLSGCDIPSFGPEPSPKPEPVHEHTYSNEWSKDGTYHWHQATCEHSELFKDKEEHHFSEWITRKEATEYEKGSEYRICDVCQYEEVQEIGKLDHTHKAGEPVIENRIEPSCTREGSYDEVIYCYECNEEMSRVAHTIEALGHNYHAESIDPTFESAGKIVYTCETCGDTYQEEGAPQLVHNYSKEWSVDSTKGTHYHACLDEGYESLRSDEASHIAGEWVTTTEATDWYDGEETTHCTVCGKEMTRTVDSYEKYCINKVLNYTYTKIDGWNRYGYVITSVKKKDIERIIIPTYLGGNNPAPVKAIENSAFAGMQNLKEVIIDASLYCIKPSAFANCPKLETIKFRMDSGGLYAYNSYILGYEECVIYKNAFYNCPSLKKIRIPSCYGTIEMGAFAGCSGLEEIELPFVGSSRTGTKVNKYFGRIFGSTEYEGSTAYSVHNTESNKDYTYYLPSNLKKVTINSGEMSEQSFYCVPLVEELYLGEYVSLIGSSCVTNCPNLKLISVISKTEEIQDNAFAYNPALETVLITGEITKFSVCVFYDCTALKNVTLPETLESMNQKAFYGCISLETVELPLSMTCVSMRTFENCSGLKSFIINENVTYIGIEAFKNCTSLESIVIPSSVQYISDDAFFGCSSLKEVTFNEGLQSINLRAFASCDLREVRLPESVVKLGNYVFGNNPNLGTIYIGTQIVGYGTNVTPFNYLRMQNEAFVIDENNPYYTSCDGVIYNTDKTILYVYPMAKKDTSFTLLDSVTSICDCIKGNPYLEEICFSTNITKLNSYTFYECSNLTSIRFNGTKEEWNAITKKSYWYSDCPLAVIHCTDGDINL